MESGDIAISIEKIKNEDADTQQEIMYSYFQNEIARLLNIDENSLNKDSLILDLDSLMLMNLINRVSESLNIKIEPEELIDVFSQLRIKSLVNIILSKIR